jgi:hypothetical protein
MSSHWTRHHQLVVEDHRSRTTPCAYLPHPYPMRSDDIPSMDEVCGCLVWLVVSLPQFAHVMWSGGWRVPAPSRWELLHTAYRSVRCCSKPLHNWAPPSSCRNPTARAWSDFEPRTFYPARHCYRPRCSILPISTLAFVDPLLHRSFSSLSDSSHLLESPFANASNAPAPDPSLSRLDRPWYEKKTRCSAVHSLQLDWIALRRPLWACAIRRQRSTTWSLDTTCSCGFERLISTLRVADRMHSELQVWTSLSIFSSSAEQVGMNVCSILPCMVWFIYTLKPT